MANPWPHKPSKSAATKVYQRKAAVNVSEKNLAAFDLLKKKNSSTKKKRPILLNTLCYNACNSLFLFLSPAIFFILLLGFPKYSSLNVAGVFNRPGEYAQHSDAYEQLLASNCPQLKQKHRLP